MPPQQPSRSAAERRRTATRSDVRIRAAVMSCDLLHKEPGAVPRHRPDRRVGILMSVESVVPTVYWMPGCSSCLRLKEFVEGTGIAFEAVNIDADPERRTDVEKAG